MLVHITSFSSLQPDKDIKRAQLNLGNDNKAFKPDFYGLRVLEHLRQKAAWGIGVAHSGK